MFNSIQKEYTQNVSVVVNAELNLDRRELEITILVDAVRIIIIQKTINDFFRSWTIFFMICIALLIDCNITSGDIKFVNLLNKQNFYKLIK